MYFTNLLYHDVTFQLFISIFSYLYTNHNLVSPPNNIMTFMPYFNQDFKFIRTRP